MSTIILIGAAYLMLMGLVLLFFKGASIANDEYDSHSRFEPAKQPSSATNGASHEPGLR